MIDKYHVQKLMSHGILFFLILISMKFVKLYMYFFYFWLQFYIFERYTIHLLYMSNIYNLFIGNFRYIFIHGLNLCKQY